MILAGILILVASLASIGPVAFLKDGILRFLSFVLGAVIIIAVVHFALMIGAVGLRMIKRKAMEPVFKMGI